LAIALRDTAGLARAAAEGAVTVPRGVVTKGGNALLDHGEENVQHGSTVRAWWPTGRGGGQKLTLKRP